MNVITRFVDGIQTGVKESSILRECALHQKWSLSIIRPMYIVVLEEHHIEGKLQSFLTSLSIHSHTRVCCSVTGSDVCVNLTDLKCMDVHRYCLD